MKTIAVLGSTGSIGTQTLQVIQSFPDQFRVVGLAAGNNMALLAEQIMRFQPQSVSVSSSEKVAELQFFLPGAALPKILVGGEGLTELAQDSASTCVVIGLSGFTGVLPTLKALESGKQVLTANKETFVTAGHLIQAYLHQIIPLDSEHSAIFQCLQGCEKPKTEIDKLTLTASGGPFLTMPLNQLGSVTVAQALRHPNWSMGSKVTIDSATMMNKGLERIEATMLFGVDLDQVELVIHPQSIVHSAVSFCDGSMLAQLGLPDMRIPIQYGLTYPERWPTSSRHLDLTACRQLDFMTPEPERFPCLALAEEAARQGGSMRVVLNAADEVAVEAFIQGQISFTDIPNMIDHAMSRHEKITNPSLAEIIEVDKITRQNFTVIARAHLV